MTPHFYTNRTGQTATPEQIEARALVIERKQARYRQAMIEVFAAKRVTLPITPLKTWTPPRGGSAAIAAIGGVL